MAIPHQKNSPAKVLKPSEDKVMQLNSLIEQSFSLDNATQ